MVRAGDPEQRHRWRRFELLDRDVGDHGGVDDRRRLNFDEDGRLGLLLRFLKQRCIRLLVSLDDIAVVRRHLKLLRAFEEVQAVDRSRVKKAED